MDCSGHPPERTVRYGRAASHPRMLADSSGGIRLHKFHARQHEIFAARSRSTARVRAVPDLAFESLLSENSTEPEACSGSGSFCGEGGIRTLGAVSSSLVFETSDFDHSPTSPCEVLYHDFLAKKNHSLRLI